MAKKNTYSEFVARHAVLITAVGLILSIVGGYFSVALYKNLRTDIEELLPTHARSGQDLKVLTERMESFDYIAVLAFSKDKVGLRKFVDELGARLNQLPKDLSARTEFKIGDEMNFFRRRGGLFLEKPDLYQVRDYVRQRIKWEKEFYNPLNIFPVGDKVKKPEMNFDEMMKKYSTGGSYDSFPDGYYATADESVYALNVFMTGKHSDIHKAHELKAAVEKAIQETDPKKFASDITIQYTGGVESFIEEHAALIADLELSTIVVILLVTAAMILYYRDVMATIALVSSLFCGTLWTFGVAYFAVGYLNANSAFLGSIVIGNGINFGIILLARYVEERKKKHTAQESSALAMRGTLTATMTAALAAGLSYGSLMLTRFRGFRQFGVIGFIGMVLCWITSYTLLPAFLSLIERRRSREYHTLSGRSWLDWVAEQVANLVQRHAKAIFAASTVLTIAALAMLPKVNKSIIETNLNKLRNKNTIEKGAGYYDRYLIDIFHGYLTHTVVLTDTREQAVAVADKLRAMKKEQGADTLLDNVQTLADFVPPHQEEKIATLREIKKELTPKIIRNLEPKEQSWVRDFLSEEAFHPFTEKDLPSLVLTKFREKSGELGKLVVVDPPLRNGGDVAWKGETLLKFVGDVRAAADSVKPGLPVAGQLPISADMVESILDDGPKATIFAFVAVVALVIILFRHLETIGLALFALLQGVLWMAGLTLACKWRINFLNFIALPITFGIGVDYGVNIFQRYREEKASGNRAGILQVVRQTGGAVILASCTTIIGYSSLLIAGNQAFVSFGELAVLGELTCVTAAVISLPAFIYYLQTRKTGTPQMARSHRAAPVHDKQS